MKHFNNLTPKFQEMISLFLNVIFAAQNVNNRNLKHIYDTIKDKTQYWNNFIDLVDDMLCNQFITPLNSNCLQFNWIPNDILETLYDKYEFKSNVKTQLRPILIQLEEKISKH